MHFPFEFPENLDEIEYKYPPYLFPTQRRNINDTTFIKYYFPFGDNGSNENPIGVMNRSLKSYYLRYDCHSPGIYLQGMLPK